MKLVRIVLIPLSWLYSAILWCRHLLYDKNIISSRQYSTPTICIGNLSLGGTGKTPFTIYLANKLKAANRVAILSRGYKRSTKGFITINESSTANQVGDEPLLMYQELSSVEIAVDSNRTRGIEILEANSQPEVILLDDAFQHRKVKAHLNILLTDYKSLYTSDRLLPSGYLRDIPSRAKKAEIIVVTKCPPEIEFQQIKKRLNLLEKQHLFFTQLRYNHLRSLDNNNILSIDELKNMEILLFTGIAKPSYLFDFMTDRCHKIKHVVFTDHHAYTIEDIRKMTKIFDNFAASNKLIVTTEKDAIKLLNPSFKEEIKNLPIFAIDVQIEFLKDEDLFLNVIANYARKN